MVSRSQQRAHLIIGGLIEISVELADRVERCRRLQAHQRVDFPPQLVAGGRCRYRHRHQYRLRQGTQRPRRRPHRGSRRQPIVNQNYRAPLNPNRRSPFPIQRLPPRNLPDLPRRCRIDGLLRNPERPHHIRLHHHQAPARHRPHCQLFLPRNAQLAHNKNVEWPMQSPRHLERHRHSTPRQSQHDRPRPIQLLADGMRQRTARVTAILKYVHHGSCDANRLLRVPFSPHAVRNRSAIQRVF